MATTTVYRAISSHQFYTTSIAWSNRRDFNGQAWFTNQLSSGSIYNQGQQDFRFINRDGLHEDYTYSNYLMYDSNSRLFQVTPARLTQYYSSITTTT